MLALIVSLLVYYLGFYLLSLWYARRRIGSSGPPSVDFIAQMAHSGWGALIVSQFVIWLPRFAWIDDWLAALIGSMAVSLLWAGPKEFLWDKYVEGQSFEDNMIDFAFYLIGAATMTVSVVLLL